MSTKSRLSSSRSSCRRDSLGIDELLDDAESCVNKTKVQKSVLTSSKSSGGFDSHRDGQASNKSSSRRKLSLTTESTIDDILQDADDVSGILSDRRVLDDGCSSNSIKGMPLPLQTSPGTRKCHDPILAGALVSRGLSLPSHKRACSNLRCTSCDFQVSQFNDVEWIEPVEYLFLRTHMPNLQRLKEKMRARKGTTAYGCQCSSFSAADPVCVTGTKLKWVCAKH